MPAVTPYITPAPTRIAPDRVLLIINSDMALSTQVADYYQSARGLVNHRLAFTTAQLAGDQSAYQATILPVVADYCDANQIECVIATPGCPIKAFGRCFEAVLGYARHILTIGLSYEYYAMSCEADSIYRGPSGYNQLKNPAMTWLTPDGFGYYVGQKIDIAQINGQRQLGVPWGRLGFPHYGGFETFANCKRLIDDCIWAEQQPKNTKSLALGFGNYTAQGVAQLQWYAWQMAQAAGLQTAYWTCDAAGTGQRGLPTAIRNNLNTWLGKQPDYNSASVYSGTEHISADVYLGSAVINDGLWTNNTPTATSEYYKSLYPKRGAWCFNWCSFGYQMSGNVIMRGGAAGIGPVMEPFTFGLPEDASVMSAALKGLSLAEICWATAPRGWAMTAWGDPLYRPFAMQGLSDGEFLTLADVTALRSATLMPIERAAAAAAANALVLSNITPMRTAQWHA